VTVDSDYRTYCEGRLAIALAGGLASERSLQGSGPGWRRLRSQKELVSFHEAGHALVASAMDFSVHTVFIIPVSEPGGVEGFAGACVSGFASDDSPKAPQMHPRDMVRDSRTAAKLCLDLAWLDTLSVKAGTSATWKDALGYYRKAKARAREIINRHWFALIALAEGLERRGNLNRAEVAGILAHNGL
jgi:Zn-dependent protease with chaperone function